MATNSSSTIDLDRILVKDDIACHIAKLYVTWENLRDQKRAEWNEVLQYIFATDTTKTSNSKNPWSNKTTIPKLCQIRDNLYANYMATLFPKRKWMEWEGGDEDSQAEHKKKAIESYMNWVVDRNEYYNEAARIVLDYEDYGNAFATVDWVDRRTPHPVTKDLVGFCGPVMRRISPLDIVFNPTATSFETSPKIVRSIVSLGEIKELLQRITQGSEQEQEEANKLFAYLMEIRRQVSAHEGSVQNLDSIYQVAGFTDFTAYLNSDTCEVLTFYGDLYDRENDKFYKNYVIKVVDRHKIISMEPNPTFFGTAPIFHVGWRIRPGNLWAMGPFDNLIGMQYRIDHLENLKADMFDLLAAPPVKVKGYIDDWVWGPNERIYVGDDGDVTLLTVPVEALKAESQIAALEARMEEMAGSPREAMGFRTPGEKTMYEVQRLELAGGRIFQNKTAQIEMQLFEQVLNAMLECARRNMDKTKIRAFDEEFKVAVFSELTPEDITGIGRIKPIAARHFAEKSNQIQNLNAFFGGPQGSDPDVKVHFSGVKLARLYEDLLDLEQFGIVSDYVRLAEQADGQRLGNSLQEQLAIETTTPTGFQPGDSDIPIEPE